MYSGRKGSTGSACFALFITLLSLLSGGFSTVHANILEDFESGSKSSYTEGTVTLETGEWLFNDALLGNLDDDQKNGTQSVRLREGYIQMEYDHDQGAQDVQFYASNAGFTGDSNGVIRLLYSVDEGNAWIQAGDQVELSDNFTLYSFDIAVTGIVRFRIERVSGGRINIDDFSFDPLLEFIDEPTLDLRVDGKIIENGDEVNFPVINVDEVYEMDFRITNIGSSELNIQSADFTSTDHFYLDESIEGAYSGGESKTVSLIFTPPRSDTFESQLTMTTNDPDQPEITVTLTGKGMDRDLTFDVVTWNIEWFGAENQGPEDNVRQMNNVLKVIRSMDADLFALQEISSQVAFYSLADSLEDYRGFTSYYSQTQQTAYLFKTSVVDSVDSGLLSRGQDSYDWAGRYPLFFELDATVNGITRRIMFYNVHAKAFGDQESYTRRLSAALSLKEYLDEDRTGDRVIFLGDFNDQLTKSTYEEAANSPYSAFLEDDFYYAVTEPLESLGHASYLSEPYRSMIDHMIINENLFDYHINGAQRVDVPNYIADFESTTSDHAPVWSRFQFTGYPEELPDEIVVEPNYPNPFNESTTIRFTLPEPSVITLEVFDILGRKVASLARNQTFPVGQNEVLFNAESLSSGIYLYRILFQDGSVVTEKMILVK